MSSLSLSMRREGRSKLQKITSMATSLPMDIILTEIFHRLPAKSLVRFKCVSKSFKTLISTPEFVDLHLRNSLSSDDYCLIALNGVHKGFYTFDLNSSKNSVINHPYPDCMNPHIFFIGSCNGLLCMGNVSEYNMLCCMVMNPCTGIYRNIEFYTLYALKSFGFGFWYDDANDDYKVVAAVSRFPFFEEFNVGDVVEGDFFGTKLEMWVYSLSANSWRFIERSSCGDWVIQGNSALIDNHLIHWKFGHESQTNPDQICCFDLRNERWADCNVPLPKCDFFVLDIGVVDGCLCILTQDKINTLDILINKNQVVHLWVMKEYGVKESWENLMAFSDSVIYPSITACPLTSCKRSSNNSEEILLTIYGSILWWYNVGDNTFRQAVMHGFPLNSQVYMFKPSLVDVPHGRLINYTDNQ